MTPTVMVFCPAYGNTMSISTVQSILGLHSHLMIKGIRAGFATFSYPEVSEVRNIALTAWYDMPEASTHLLFVDSDMGFPAQLITDMLLFDEPMVGAMYPKKSTPVQWAASGLGPSVAERRGDFMKVAGLGMGCFLIKREAVTQMLEKMPELIDTRIALHAGKDMLPKGRIFRFFDPMENPDSGRMSEDLSFCHRWRVACGGEIWAAVGHMMEHVGMHAFRACYIEEAAKSDREPNLAYAPDSAA